MEPTLGYKISSAQDFSPEEAIVAFERRNASGEPLVVKIRAIAWTKIGALFKGLPTLRPPTQTDPNVPPLADEVRAEQERQATERWEAVMREACVEPRLLFGDEAGDGVRWNDLDYGTQQAWMGAVLDHSGFKLRPEMGGDWLSFRVLERGGQAVCGGPGRAVPPTEATA